MSRAAGQAITGWLVLCVVVGLLLAGCAEPTAETSARWRCKDSPAEGLGGVIVCRDDLNLQCHAVWFGGNKAASLGVVPCDRDYSAGGGQ